MGVWPCLLTLKCGVTLATYGRPGIRVRATDDPACLNWNEPIENLESIREPEPYPGHTLNTASCCYTNMVALDDRTAALVYSDFRVKDEQGIPRKSMMYSPSALKTDFRRQEPVVVDDTNATLHKTSAPLCLFEQLFIYEISPKSCIA